MLTEADALRIGFPVRLFTKRRIASYIHLLVGAAARGNAEQERSCPSYDSIRVASAATFLQQRPPLRPLDFTTDI